MPSILYGSICSRGFSFPPWLRLVLLLLFGMGGLSLAVTHPDTGIQNVSENLDVFDQRQTLKRVRTLPDHQKQEIHCQ